MSSSSQRYVRGAWRRIAGSIARRQFRSHATVRPRPDLVKLGTDYGGWVIPEHVLDSDSVCYLAGVGEDASFDLALIERYGCRVFAFDPTPRSRDYVAANIDDPLYSFHPVGLSDADSEETFYAADHPGGISLLARGAEVESVLPVRSVDSLMKQLGHDQH